MNAILVWHIRCCVVCCWFVVLEANVVCVLLSDCVVCRCLSFVVCDLLLFVVCGAAGGYVCVRSFLFFGCCGKGRVDN